MASACSHCPSLPPFPRHPATGGAERSSRLLCSVAASATKAAPPAEEKQHWKAGEFPGMSESSKPRRTQLKNVKKRVNDQAQAKAWVSTVTEALAEKI